MPIRDEADFIAESLGAVLNQDYPDQRLEVLIVDGMSTDDTKQIIYDLSKQHPNISLAMLDNPKHVIPAALNIGIRRARGEFILRIDGRAVIAPNYVRTCIEVLKRREAHNVGGRQNQVGADWWSKVIAAAAGSRFGGGGPAYRHSTQEELVDTVYLGCWARESFERFGLFDEELARNQDDEFNYRVRGQGGRILISPDIKSEYYGRGRLSELWTQYFQFGYWKVRVMQKHLLQMRPRQFAPPLFVATLLVGALLSTFVPMARALWLALVVSYLLATASAAVLTARRAGWSFLPVLPLAFATLHIGYGLGFLVGLVRFVHRWSDR